jgi:hypothetical protein
VFKLVEEALDDIALLVEFGVIGALKGAVALGWDETTWLPALAIFSQKWSAS